MQYSKEIKTGFVALTGRPNVGKSTLMNALLGEKVSITSHIPQTTRYLIRGILNTHGAQIVFVDGPGVHSFRDPLAQRLNTIAKRSLKDVDLILYVVDTTRQPAVEEEKTIRNVLLAKVGVIMALNKIDKRTTFINDYIKFWQDREGRIQGKKSKLLYYIPISAKTGQNLEDLVEAIRENLPVGHPFYDEETVTDFPLKFRAADIIREKLFLKLKDEIPHSIAVEIEDIEDKGKVVYIKANIYVNRVSQKRIVIGRGAEFIREAGTISRMELENILGKRVYLDTQVKVLSDWQDKSRILKSLGYDDTSI